MADINDLPAWALRALDPDTPTTEARETVRTMSMDSRLFPTIRMINGKLTKLKPNDAYDMAVEKGDYIQFESDAAADTFSVRLSKMIDRKRSIMSQMGR
nr:hypothetical protein [uncultured Mediterranean phage uvMED]|tara:strand:+ start:54 stop:350 length:297 start_codon:yes stop_codon:yes gene_type:complete